MKKWDELPNFMKNEEVETYYNILKMRQVTFAIKRGADFILALFLCVLFIPIFVIIALFIKVDSPGRVFFRQERITQYGRRFKIIKFRTMVDSNKVGALVTVKSDNRITNVGSILRKYRIDELPQVINVLVGDMSFVGTRPEVEHYVKRYTREMCATLLLPAGITSMASILYKDEDCLLENASNVEETYINEILPAKMKINLQSIRKFSLWHDLKTMVLTVLYVFRKDEDINDEKI